MEEKRVKGNEAKEIKHVQRSNSIQNGIYRIKNNYTKYA